MIYNQTTNSNYGLGPIILSMSALFKVYLLNNYEDKFSIIYFFYNSIFLQRLSASSKTTWIYLSIISERYNDYFRTYVDSSIVTLYVYFPIPNYATILLVKL